MDAPGQSKSRQGRRDPCPGGEEAGLVLSTPRRGVSCDDEKGPEVTLLQAPGLDMVVLPASLCDDG